jgi:hypothetical protein
MPSFSYKKVKATNFISEGDKDFMVAMFLATAFKACHFFWDLSTSRLV